jgi:hydroxyethylthiazole kinase
LDNDFVKLCHHVCDTAGQLNKPIILDPVGAGASRFRTETALLLLAEYPISIVRGNASEIMALAGSDVKTKGVDSSADSQHAVASAKILSQVHDTAIAISGKVDVIVDGEQFKLSDHGSQRMSLVTGMGCLLSSIVAAFHAVHSDRFDAAAAAMVFYSLCGERADSKSSGPASFKIEFIDTLHAW